jgi:hypothetical protein
MSVDSRPRSLRQPPPDVSRLSRGLIGGWSTTQPAEEPAECSAVELSERRSTVFTVDSTWESRDLPVLQAVVQLYEVNGRDVRAEQIEEALGLPRETVQAALRALKHSDVPYLTNVYEVAEGYIWHAGAPTGHARRLVGAWPTPETLADRVITALNDAADNEPDEAKKGKLRRGAEAVAGVGRDVLTDVMAQVITKGMYGT